MDRGKCSIHQIAKSGHLPSLVAGWFLSIPKGSSDPIHLHPVCWKSNDPTAI